MIRIFKYYFALVRKYHFLQDLLIGVIITYLCIDYSFLMLSNKILTIINDWTKILIPTLTFQAGLHTTSLTFFSNSNSPLLVQLKDEYIKFEEKESKYKKIDQVFAYFSWAILIQMLTLLLSLFSTVYLSSHDNQLFNLFYIVVFYYLLVFGSIYSMILSLRNVGLLFSILTAANKRKT